MGSAVYTGPESERPAVEHAPIRRAEPVPPPAPEADSGTQEPLSNHQIAS